MAPVLGWGSGGCARCVEQQQQSSATPPSIAIAAPVLGDPEVVRVVLNSSSKFVRVVLNSIA